MQRKSSSGKSKPIRPFNLLLVEGETEVEFYSALTEKYCHGKPKDIKSLKGNFNIYKKITDKIVAFVQANPGRTVRVYICIDLDKPSDPVFNEAHCRDRLVEFLQSAANCVQIIPIIANLMIESLFFRDIEGIYDFLKLPKSKRRPQKYSNPTTFTHIELNALFRQSGKTYRKGHRVENFVNSLDLDKICQAPEIAKLIKSINS